MGINAWKQNTAFQYN